MRHYIKSILVFMVCTIANISLAGNPEKNYTVKYIEDNAGDCHPVNINIKVTPTKIYANDNKYWDCKYLGKIERIDRGAKFYFHQYYLINKQVYFIISDDKIMEYKGIFHYLIFFDGEVQYAL